MMAGGQKKIEKALAEKRELYLFLDYDGTLADFAANPDLVEPNPEIIMLLEALQAHRHIHPAIISGRKLAHIQELVPIKNMLLAGTYGLEMRMPDGKLYHPLDLDLIRPQLEQLKTVWISLLDGQEPFYLEDKDWTLAIHARFARKETAQKIIDRAEQQARRTLDAALFQIQADDKFLEARPWQASKGKCMESLLKDIPVENAGVVYMGDDDKDEEAFAIVQAWGGYAIRVCSNVIKHPIEDWKVANPQAARQWLWSLIDKLGRMSP
ncbi:MAG: trehalose-phosphatase [Chloroflexi bacterium]|nr:trehalose-phosphatase [Chloroflexota bacterium]